MTTIPSTLPVPDGHAPLRAADVANHSDSWLRQMELAQMAGMGGTGPRPHAGGPVHGEPSPDMPAARPAAALQPVLPRAVQPPPSAAGQDSGTQDDDSDSAADTGQAASGQAAVLAQQASQQGSPPPAAPLITDTGAATAAQTVSPAAAPASPGPAAARGPALAAGANTAQAAQGAQAGGNTLQAATPAADGAVTAGTAIPAPFAQQAAAFPFAGAASGAALAGMGTGAAQATSPLPAGASAPARAASPATAGAVPVMDAGTMSEAPPESITGPAPDMPDTPQEAAGTASPEQQAWGKRNLHITGAGPDVNVWIRDTALTPAQSTQLAAKLAADMAGMGLRLKGAAVNGKPLPEAAEEYSDINDTFAPGPDHGHARITTSEQTHGTR